MNVVKLNGYIKDIDFSHEISGIRYGKANLIVPNKNDEDIISLVYKEHVNHYAVGDKISLQGNLRSYSQQLGDKNKVNIYVFTYFDIPKFEDGYEVSNYVELDGRICKMNPIRNYDNGSSSLSFILANNIFLENKKGKINNYIPVVCWDDNATKLKDLSISTQIKIYGKLHSRTYKKYVNDGLEIKTAHEVILDKFELL